MIRNNERHKLNVGWKAFRIFAINKPCSSYILSLHFFREKINNILILGKHFHRLGVKEIEKKICS